MYDVFVAPHQKQLSRLRHRMLIFQRRSIMKIKAPFGADQD